MLSDSLSGFAGLWQLTRRIEDRLIGRSGELSGKARFTPDGAGLRYDEEGVLHLDGQPPVQAKRSYLWRQGADGIEVWFDDGRFFHRFDAEGVSAAQHWCDPDDYQVRYDFSAWPRWQSAWQVKGPRKDYLMVSEYQR